MKTTLVYVGIGVAGFNDCRPKGDREGSWIGHGIASVGACAKAAGYNVNLIDLRQLTNWGQFAEMVKLHPSDVYGLSISAVDYKSALKAIIIICENSPKSRIIVGGIHPSIFPEMYDFNAVDTVVTGEGEISFVELLDNIKEGKELPKRVVGKKPDLNSIPWVERNLFNYSMELDCIFIPEQDTPSITMLAGRGCPYHCAYCQPAENVVFGKPHRMRSVSDVIAELTYLKAVYNFQSITFWDDTFTFNKKWVMDFCDRYKERGFSGKIVACSRADIICNNEDMIERLADIDVECLVIGMESGSQRVLDFIQKGTTVEQNIKASEICHKYGIKVFATYMYGLPTETKEDVLATARMIDKAKPDYPSPFWYVPIPGTKLHKYCEDNNLILDDTRKRTIERTCTYLPTLKDVDYQYITDVMNGAR